MARIFSNNVILNPWRSTVYKDDFMENFPAGKASISWNHQHLYLKLHGLLNPICRRVKVPFI
jgi:hypothetical protein